jgi:hypothetical protein
MQFGKTNGEDRIINKSLWTPRSPDLNSCDFYLWEKLGSVVYTNNPHDLEAPKQNIREELYNIQQRELLQVSQNLFNLMASCLNTNTAYYVIRFKSSSISIGGIVTSKNNKKSTNKDFFVEFCMYNIESLNSPVLVCDDGKLVQILGS